MKFRAPATLSAALTQFARVRGDICLALWSLVVLLMPFYMFPNGLPQPSDLLGVLLLTLLLRTWNGRMAPGLRFPLKSLIRFLVYVVIVNVV